jgi:ABC-type antimicrobial peptide transport system permease subunit
VALGARPADVLAGVVGGMARLTGIGLVLGALLAIGATRVLAGLLIGVGAFEPLTWVAVPSILAAVAVLASLVPALRAASVDPVIALRAE